MKVATRQRLMRICGTLGYLSASLLWLWAAVLVLPWLLAQQGVKQVITPPQNTQHSMIEFHYEAPPTWMIYVVLFIAFLVTILGIWAALKAPKSIVETATKTTHHAAEQLAVNMTHHQPQPQKRVARLTATIEFYLKIGLVVIALIIIALASQLIPQSLEHSLALIVGAFLGIWPLVWFSLQRMLMPKID